MDTVFRRLNDFVGEWLDLDSELTIESLVFSALLVTAVELTRLDRPWWRNVLSWGRKAIRVICLLMILAGIWFIWADEGMRSSDAGGSAIVIFSTVGSMFVWWLVGERGKPEDESREQAAESESAPSAGDESSALTSVDRCCCPTSSESEVERRRNFRSDWWNVLPLAERQPVSQ